VRKLQLLLFFLLVGVASFGQGISFGGKIGYVTYHRTYAPPIKIEGTQIYKPVNPYSLRDGWQFTIFSQVAYSRLAVRASGAYAYNIGGDDNLVINNRNNSSNEKPSDRWMIGTGENFQNLELTLLGGYKINNWLIIWAGPGLWHQQVQDTEKLQLYDLSIEEDPYNELKNLNKMNRFYYAVQESYVPWVVTGKIEVEAEFRQFLFGISYDKSLTPVGNHLEYKNKRYFFRQSTDRYVVSIGFIFPTKLSFSKKQ
jgi:hypothetical protein